MRIVPALCLSVTFGLSGCTMVDVVAKKAQLQGQFHAGMSQADVARVLTISPPKPSQLRITYDASGERAFWIPGPNWSEPWFFEFQKDSLSAWGPVTPGTNSHGYPIIIPAVR